MYAVDQRKIRRLRQLGNERYSLEKSRDLILAPLVACKGVYSLDKKNEIKRAIIKLYDMAFESKYHNCYTILAEAYEGNLEGMPQLLKDNPVCLHLAIDFICSTDESVKRISLNHLKESDIQKGHEKALDYMRRYLATIYSLESAKGKEN